MAHLFGDTTYTKSDKYDAAIEEYIGAPWHSSDPPIINTLPLSPLWESLALKLSLFTYPGPVKSLNSFGIPINTAVAPSFGVCRDITTFGIKYGEPHQLKS